MKLKMRTIKKASLPSWPLLMLVLLLPTSGHGQAVVATVAAGHAPEAVAINTVTNKIYVANYLGGTVTIIDGATNSTSTVQVGAHPLAIAVNEVTNKIYVAQRGSFPASGGDPGGITVIDGASGATTKVVDPNAFLPRAVAVNSVTNKIYVANFRNITVLDGDTTSTTTVTDPNTAGLSPYSLAVNQASNKIYVANNGLYRTSVEPGNVTVIDGATDSTTTVTDPNAFTPIAVAVNSATNKIYVANVGNFPWANHGNVTVIDGATNSTTTLVDPNILAPHAVAINEITNKAYVVNINDSAQDMKGSVTVIDGAANAIANISDPAAISPYAVAVNDKANKIYVANYGVDPFASPGTNLPGNVTIIDGATNAFTNLRDPAATNPNAIAVDSITNQIYVANVISDNLSVIDGGGTSTNFALAVAESGSGTGTVTSSPSGIDCPSVCSTVFESGATVTLTASPASGSTFAGWSGACSGTGACTVTVSATVSVTATFNTTTPSDFSLSLASAQLMVQRGGQSSDAVTIAPINGSFESPVQLSCSVSGPPPTPMCAFSAASVTPGTNSVTSTLTVTVPAATAMWPSSSPQSDKLLFGAWLSLLVVITAIREFKKQQLHRWAVYGCLICLVFSLMGCGGGNNKNISPVTSQPANYMVTVIGTSGPIQHTAQVRVTAE